MKDSTLNPTQNHICQIRRKTKQEDGKKNAGTEQNTTGRVKSKVEY